MPNEWYATTAGGVGASPQRGYNAYMGSYNAFLGDIGSNGGWFSDVMGQVRTGEDHVAAQSAQDAIKGIESMTNQAHQADERSSLDQLLKEVKGVYSQGVAAAERLTSDRERDSMLMALRNAYDRFMDAYYKRNEELRARAAEGASLEEVAHSISIIGDTSADLAKNLSHVYIAYEQGRATKEQLEEKVKWMKNKRQTLKRLAAQLQTSNPAKAAEIRRNIAFFDDRMDTLGLKSAFKTYWPIALVGGFVIIGGTLYLLLR